jgi:hypothetical protein
MPTPRVVEALDVVENIGSGFIAGAARVRISWFFS